MRPAQVHRQRGAATILAVMFLVVSVSLMVVAALNLSASDISDTALHSDAIEALFIAETGIEHATHYYAGGTACLDLAPIGPVSLGRGHFQVTAAHDTDFSGTPLPASQCRVAIEGRVELRGAQRRIGAILNRESAAFTEHFPTAAEFAADWTLDITQDHDGALKGWSSLYGNAPGSSGGHLIGRTNYTDGANRELAFTATRTLDDPFVATAGMFLRLKLYFQKPNLNTGGTRQHVLQLHALDSDGNPYLIWDRSGRENITAWTEVDLSLPLPGAMAGQTIDRIRIAILLEEQGNQGVAAAVDGIEFGPDGAGGGVALREWREAIQ